MMTASRYAKIARESPTPETYPDYLRRLDEAKREFSSTLFDTPAARYF